MKLKDIEIGETFILVRSGGKYIKAEYQLDDFGVGTKRYFVLPLGKEGLKQYPARTLSLQCKVKPVMRCSSEIS